MLNIPILLEHYDIDPSVLPTDLDENFGDFAFTKESKENTFQVKINVRYFRPEEVTVKVLHDRFIVVECIHQKKKDEQSYISRHFIGKMLIPEEYDIDKVVANLSPLGVIMVSCPKKTNLKTTSKSESLKYKL